MTQDSRPHVPGSTRDTNAPAELAATHAGDLPTDKGAADVSVGPARSAVATCVDMMAFNELRIAAQQCGLAINTDSIVAVRDYEFRTGRYQRAIFVIEGLCSQLDAQAARRQGELRREEMQYKSGKLKMTPKEWMLRQRRVVEQTQKIDRARRQFARVLDGLTVLRSAQPEETPHAEEAPHAEETP